MAGDTSLDASVGLRRAEELYARVFSEYGDDSVAQLGGVHLACEQSSNVLTKILERGRLMSYLEQSTRYIPYDSRLPSGHYRYHRDQAVLESPLGARYVGEMDRMFDTYARAAPGAAVFRRTSEPETRRRVRARAPPGRAGACLDALRGLLPAGSLSNVGIFGSGQSYEQLLLRMRAHPLPEARRYADLILVELRKVIPSFLSRIDRPERGGVWTEYLETCHQAMDAVVHELWPVEVPASGRSVKLTDFDPAGEDKVLVAMCYPYLNLPEEDVARHVAALGPQERRSIMRAYVGDRSNRRHRPGRALECTSYRFDIVADYGAFRDLQRHRMLTVEWQPLGTDLGFELPPLVAEAGLADRYLESLERSKSLHDALAPYFPEQSAYTVALAFNIRFVLQLNAREAMHVLELRSGPQGHPAYRRIAQEMHRLIAEQAGHHALADTMSFVDHSETGLGRLEAEQRSQSKRESAPSL